MPILCMLGWAKIKPFGKMRNFPPFFFCGILQKRRRKSGPKAAKFPARWGYWISKLCFKIDKALSPGILFRREGAGLTWNPAEFLR